MKKNGTQIRECLNPSCSKYAAQNINEMLISPFTEGTLETQKLFAYFLHFAPDIDSVHSEKISSTKHSELFSQMMQDRHFEYHEFCTFNKSIDKELSKCGLEGNTICLKCKRYVCKKKKPSKDKTQETDLDCFLRHIRNSIAHGRVYFCHRGNRIHIMFEDYNSDTEKLSARIICIKADLEYWKKVLSVSYKYN